MLQRFYCPCCGYDTLKEETPGTYQICSICFWEDDPIQFSYPDYEGGANRVSLRKAQINFEKFGVCEKDMITNVTKPDKTYNRNPQWRLK